MKIETRFDPEEYRKLAFHELKVKTQQGVVGYFILLGLVTVFFVMSIFMILSNDKTGYVFLSLSIAAVIVFAYILIRFFGDKRKYILKVNEIVNVFKNGSETITWEFSEKEICCKDAETEFKAQWKVFSHFTITQGVICLYRDDDELGLPIFKGQNSPEVYQQIIDLVASHLPPGKTK